MLNYRKRCFIDYTNGDPIIKTDTGAVWHTSTHSHDSTPITTWWNKQHQSDLRRWQKDICVQSASMALGAAELYTIYRKGNGYTQPHDMCLVYFPNNNLLIFSTLQHFWIVPRTLPITTVSIENSIGVVTDEQFRRTVWWPLHEQLLAEFAAA